LKDWLREIFEAYTPVWIFRLTGVLVSIVVVLTQSWPGNRKDGYADDLWPDLLWLYAAWGVVEVLGLWLREPGDR
jgi:hypothetical protein